MKTNQKMWSATVLGLGVVASIGCRADSSPRSADGQPAIVAVASVGKSARLVLKSARPHDISNADLAGTVQFQVVSAPASDVSALLGSAIYYQDAGGRKISAELEFSTIKGSGSEILTVRSTEPLAENAWYGLVVVGNEVQVTDAARTGTDGRWKMRLFTGPNPQVVGVSEDGTHIHVSISEPVNLKDAGLSISSNGAAVAGCFETTDGCVTEVVNSNVLAEEISFRLERAAVPQVLELNSKGASLSPIQLSQGSWKVGLGGAQAWLRPAVN